MQRFKILGGAALFLLTLFILMPLSENTATSIPGPEALVSKSALQETAIDQEEVRRYQLRQQQLKSTLTDYFNKAIASGEIVGAGVSIVKGDSILLSDGFGKRKINDAATVNGQTIFRLGSLSKGFAGILAASLEDEGKLDWEDKVIDYLPEFQLGDRQNTAQITLANILSHTAGTPYHSFTNLVEAGLSVKEIATHFKEVAPISEPGSLYSYQNAMFSLCQEMMHKATGKKITTSLNNRFFKPLGMHSATMDHQTISDADNVAMPHSKWRKSFRSRPLTNRYYNAVAAGGINASALDMAKWMRFLLGYRPEVMQKSVIKEAFNPIIEHKGKSKYYQRWPGHLKSYYGFGWRIHKMAASDGSDQEQTIWHHGGSVNSYRNEIAVYPEVDLGICVLLNSNSKLARRVIPDLYEIVQEVYKASPRKKAQKDDTKILAGSNFE
ncbi:beta-lactamase family protein [Aggregatimonas sangjinii]|uniref:Beta-lactamase family protein n=1 Tax=Aggregatimonas sangjinii TaxID=2583587 RepID=A0A5B7SJN0_9FLAO|nr:serine hydrolase domain-containing protein [Aggregatimonas sangjinii]QCW98664.1 beta-lactamase family protein [Aggregatimonas sangjinii]